MNVQNETYSVRDSINFAMDLARWLHERIHLLALPPIEHLAEHERRQAYAALFSLALDHYDSFVFLMDTQRISSAFAIVRSMVEACVRAKWMVSNSPDAVRNFISGKDRTGLNNMLHDIASFDPDFSKIYSQWLSGDNLKFLHSLTHGGIGQLKSLLGESSIEPAYPEDEQKALIVVAVVTAMSSAFHLFSASDNSDDLLNQWNKKDGEVVRAFRAMKMVEGV